MKLNYYIKKLQEIEKRYPNALLVFEEGGEFKKVKYTPTEGFFKAGNEPFEAASFSTRESDGVNAVSLN